MDTEEYLNLLEPHKRALAQLKLDLEFFLRDVGTIDVFSIQSRMKTLVSAAQKSTRLNIRIDELDDLAGIRIIVGTQNEIPVIERFFTRQECGNDLIVAKKNEYQRKSGYRATHLVVQLKSHYQRSMHEGRVEIQLQTVFGSAFNYLSRSWRYKANYQMGKKWDAKFMELSNVLVKLESLANELHAEVVEAMSLEDSSALTPHTFRVIAKNIFGESISYNDAVDNCRWYTELGCKTNGHLKAFFERADVRELYEYVTHKARTSQVLAQLCSMGKTNFWGVFGARINYPGTREFIESLANNQVEE